jgi:hypothetical protein
MNINHDYSYTNKSLIDLGYATIGIHSLVFDRHFTEEEMADNRKATEEIGNNTEAWNKRCDQKGEMICEQMECMMKILNNKYLIAQYNENVKYGTHDLHFYCNRGWNKKDWYDHIQMCFNEKKGQEENNKLLSELLDILSPMELKNVGCRVQYETVVDEKKLHDDVLEICKQYEGKTITYRGTEGKIKYITNSNGQNEYGFFKKGARSKYYRINDSELIMLNIA